MVDIRQFRRQTGPGKVAGSAKSPIPLREKILVGMVLINLVFLALWQGGTLLWVEMYALAFAVLTFVMLAVPLPGEDLEPAFSRPRAVIRRLLTFPVFWLGLILYTYVWIQSWNVEWVYTVTSRGGSRMVRQEYIEWLPRGITAPFEETNPARMMFSLALSWLTVCVVWAGLYTRRVLGFLLHGIAVILLIWGCIALYQDVFEIRKILGIWETHPSKRDHPIPFWGTMVNQNHSANFIVLGVALSMGLFLSGMVRSARKLRLGGAHLLYIGSALILSVSAAKAEARGSLVLLVLLWVAFLFLCSVFFVRQYRLKGAILPIVILALFGGYASLLLINPVTFENLKREYEATVSLQENPELEARYHMNQILWKMIVEKPWLGHGSGSFRYIHLAYLKTLPEWEHTYRVRVKDSETGKMRWEKRRFWWRQAHNDWLELPIELGVIGMIPVLGIGLWAFVLCIVRRRGLDYGMLVVFCGLGLLILGAAWEFHFRMTVVLYAWMLVFIATLRLIDVRGQAARKLK